MQDREKDRQIVKEDIQRKKERNCMNERVRKSVQVR